MHFPSCRIGLVTCTVMSCEHGAAFSTEVARFCHQSFSSYRKVKFISLIKFHFTEFSGYSWCCQGAKTKTGCLIQGRRHNYKTAPGKEKDMSPPLPTIAVFPNQSKQSNHEQHLGATYDISPHGKESVTERGDGNNQ